MSKDLENAEIRNNKHNQIVPANSTLYWTQFELDLVHCIRHEYPIIFQKEGDVTAYERALQIKKAWRNIASKFKHIEMTVENIKAQWKDISDSYFKTKINTSSRNIQSKFLDGTLSFLDETHIPANNEMVNPNIPPLNSRTDDNFDTEDEMVDIETVRAVNDTDSSNIRQLIHEEIDIEDEYIKVEEEKETDDSNYINSLDDCIQLPENESVDESQKKWDEEELLNATRLTLEMVEQLIHIQSRRYFTEPVSSTSSSKTIL